MMSTANWGPASGSVDRPLRSGESELNDVEWLGVARPLLSGFRMVRRLLLGLTALGLGGCFGSMLDAPADPVDAEPPDAQWPDAGAPDAQPVPVCAPPAPSLETGHHF